jgi:hypothetical protein
MCGRNIYTAEPNAKLWDLYLFLIGADVLRYLCSSKSTHTHMNAPAYNLELVIYVPVISI